MISTAMLLFLVACSESKANFRQNGRITVSEQPTTTEELKEPTETLSPPPKPSKVPSTYPIQIDMDDLMSMAILEPDCTFLAALQDGWVDEWMNMYLYPGSDENENWGAYERIWYDEANEEYTYYGIYYDQAEAAGWGNEWKLLISGEYSDSFSYQSENYYSDYDENVNIVPDGTIAYFRFSNDIGKYVVSGGNYILQDTWSWTNNEIVRYDSSGRPTQWQTNNQLPPVATTYSALLPNSFSALNCPYTSCSSSVLSMSLATAVFSVANN